MREDRRRYEAGTTILNYIREITKSGELDRAITAIPHLRATKERESSPSIIELRPTTEEEQTKCLDSDLWTFI